MPRAMATAFALFAVSLEPHLTLAPRNPVVPSRALPSTLVLGNPVVQGTKPPLIPAAASLVAREPESRWIRVVADHAAPALKFPLIPVQANLAALGLLAVLAM